MAFLTVQKGSDKEILDLLKENTIGTPGKSMVYRHKRIEEKLRHIPEPWFVTLRLRDQLTGTACFCKRTVRLKGDPGKAFYIRYFTFRQKFRSASDLARGSSPGKKSKIKQEIMDLLAGKDLPANHLYYAYVDPDNVRSLRQIEAFGFKTAGTFKTVFFSRFFPNLHADVSQLGESTSAEIIDRINREYAAFELFSSENIFYENGFFVLRENGGVVAGLQAHREHWEILALSGPNGKRLLRLLGTIPLLNRLLSPDFHFLSVECLFCDKGKEKQLELLLEHCLAHFRCHTAITCLDPSSTQYKTLSRLNNGWISRFVKEKTMAVVVKSDGPDERPLTGPCYVSAFDVM